MKIAIHQPNLFPWLGYFDKINKADLFIYLDHVENNPRDSGWFKSVKILVNRDEYWLTQPIKRPESVTQPINEMKVTDERAMRKNLKTVKFNYSKSPYFKNYFPLVEKYFSSDKRFIAEKNIRFIEEVCEILSIDTPRKKSSAYKWRTHGTEMLINTVKKFGGDAYITGGGSEGYQKDFLFEENNIKLTYQNFSHPPYKQLNSKGFTPGLSILDALFNVGSESVKKLLNKAK